MFISVQTESRSPFTPPWPPARRLSHALWHGRSVRAQLLIVFVLIDVVAGLVAGAVTILQARTSTRVEIAASMELAQLLVGEAVGLIQQEVPAEKFLTDLSSQLRLVRHVRIVVKDATGAPLVLRRPAAGSDTARDERAPAWFAALIAPRVASRNIPVIVNGQRIGAVALIVNVAVIVLLYFLFGRVLDPLSGVGRGLADLEQRNYRVRLARPPAQELATITERFNALAEALDAARAENLRLNERLITAQDDERRRTAMELHDEVGPSLFGLKANAGSIGTAVGALPEETRRSVQARVGDILAIIEHLQTINRSLLNRLRPMALGHVPLRDLLSELVRERARQNPQIAFSLSADKLMRSYGDSIDLTIYRCVQESLTNAIRHAQPGHVGIEVGEAAEGPSDKDRALKLTVRDDGRGIDPTTPMGFGLRGMQERVQGLGGSYKVEGAGGRGTCVRIVIPVPGRPDGAEVGSRIGSVS